MEPRPRLLLFGPVSDLLANWLKSADVDTSRDASHALQQLQNYKYDAVVGDPNTFTRGLADFIRDESVLGHINEGLAVIEPDGTVIWANTVLKSWCPSDPTGQNLISALNSQALSSENSNPLAIAADGRMTHMRICRSNSTDKPFLDLTISPVPSTEGPCRQLIVVARNVTSEVEQQKKLDALHAAGRELAGLDPELLAEMTLPTRVELLKHNLRRYIHDLLRYDIIELRVLDRRTEELKPLLEEGMTAEAAQRKLFARPTDNGVTGYVAATGRSYLCPDTASDPLYLQGASGARSSMTVPLMYQDEVVGTLNVESPRINAFGPEDLQFTELFSKEIATALHTLELLTAQQSCTVTQSIEAISREIALPMDAVLSSASTLLQKYTEKDLETANHLQRILDAARSVKERVLKVGQDISETNNLGQTESPLAGRRVLVIDQDERMRRSAHLLLGRLGSSVETAASATEGLALAAGSAFDAVLLEVKPPDLGGYETYVRLRANQPGIRVAMTTGFGYDSAHSIVKARSDGMNYVLFKPFRQDQLIRAVLDGSGTADKSPVTTGQSA